MAAESSAPVKVLIVCMGNICRSPAGEGILRDKIHRAGLDGQILVDSAGTLNYHAGELPDGRMRKAAADRGISLNMKARQVTSQDFQEFDYIVVMDDQNMTDIARFRPAKAHKAQLFKILDLIPARTGEIVPDPYYGSRADFDLVLDLLDEGCEQLLQHICRETGFERASA